MNIQNITLDISKQPAVASVVAIGQGDTGGTTICAAVYDNGVAADLDGMTAMFEMRLPDGQSYVRDANCTVEGNEITYVVDEEHCASVAGVTDEAYFDIMDGPSVVYSTGRFRVNVLRAAHYDGEPAESWDNAVDSFLANLRDDADEIIGEVGGRQDANDAHQAANDLAQEANNAQQAINNQMASGGVFQVLATGQYDASTLKPTIVGARVGVFYLVPTGASSDPHLEWIYNGSDFELVGTNAGVLDPVSTGDIDSVVADNSPQGNSVLNLSGLTYLWAKLKAAFAALTHAHAASDITSGQLAIANGGTGASTAVGAKAAIVDGQALSPASVTATGAVAGSSVSDSVGSLAALRDSVGQGIAINTNTNLADANAAPVGVSRVNSSATANVPSASTGVLLTLRVNSTMAAQLAVFATASYFRISTSQGWQGWRAIDSSAVS